MKKKNFKSKDSQKKNRQPSSGITINEKLIKSYYPYLIFFILAFFYIAPDLFSEKTIFTTDGGILGFGRQGRSFNEFINPFSQQNVWNSALGGMPFSIGLIEVVRFLFTDIFIPFFYDYQVHYLFFVFLITLSGICMYVLLREFEFDKALATALSIGYQLSPHSMSFTYAGHFSKMGVIAILPILFYFLKKGLDTGKLKHFVWLAFFMGIDIYFAHLQYVHYSFLIIGFYFIYRIISDFIDTKQFRAPLLKATFFTLAVIVGLGFGARGFVPQYLHTTTDSKRAGAQGEGVTQEFATSWSLHAEEIASLLVPEFVHFDTEAGRYYWGKNVFKLNADYFGGIVFFLAVLSAFYFRRIKTVRFFYIIFMFGILFALGSATPVFNVMFHIVPGMKSFRAPSFMIFVSAFSAYVLAGIVLQNSFNKKFTAISKKITIIIIGVAGLLFVLFINSSIVLDPWRALFYQDLAGNKLQIYTNNLPYLSTGFLISSFIFLIVGVLIYFISKSKINPLYLPLILSIIFIADFWRIDKKFLKTEPVSSVVPPSERKVPAYEYIKESDESLYRVLPLHQPLQSRFKYNDLILVSGFNDFADRRYDTILSNLNNNNLLNFAKLVNAKYLVSPQEINVPILNKAYEEGNLFVYKNSTALPWFYIRNNFAIERDENNLLQKILSGQIDLNTTAAIEKNIPEHIDFSNAENTTLENYKIDIMKYESNMGNVELLVTADTPGFLVFSENYHPDWECYINGEKVELFRANYLFKGVFFDVGKHTIRFAYRSKIVDLSIMITIISFSVICFALIYITIQKKCLRGTIFWNNTE